MTTITIELENHYAGHILSIIQDIPIGEKGKITIDSDESNLIILENFSKETENKYTYKRLS